MPFFLKKNLLSIICLLLLVLPVQISAANNGWRYGANSVLSQGDWYKIKIEKGTGIYKLTYDDLKKIGLNNPADVKIHGYGGWMLDEDFTRPYVDDLPEVSIWMSKDRGSFGPGDYILFYARGDVKWEYNEKNKEFEHSQNPYSSDSYYFVTESSEYPKLIESQPGAEQGATIVSTYNDYALHELEEVNMGSTGREFYGENFLTNNKREFSFSTQGATSDPAIIRYNFISRATLSSCTFNISLNGTQIKTEAPNTVTDSETFAITTNSAVETTALKDVNTITVDMTKRDNGVTNTYLNYIRINYKRQLKPYGAVTLFRNTTASDQLTFRISEANSSLMIFDVTDNTSVNRIETQVSGSTMSFSVSQPGSVIREFALIDLSKEIPAPTIVTNGKVENQNLHALSNADMIIIAPKLFQPYAQELAGLHEAESGLTSHVVLPESIYNEFSSGKPDVTAYRRFMKMFFDRATDENEKPKYLLLFGSGTFDNRFIGTWTDNEKQAMLLTYQSKESLVETSSYVTDDYMGFLDDAIEGNDLNAAVLHLGIGRIPARTAQEAQDVVNKIKDYMTNRNKGLWQNNISFVADDFVGSRTGSYSTEKQHIDDAEEFSNYLETNHPDFIVNKIYEDAYERVVEANGARYPTATQALLNRINNGTLALNFIGHGSTLSWTHENLLLYSHINNLTNDKLPLWITATCDFTRFDGSTLSAGEWALLKRTGGAIALFSTVRAVYIAHNTEINRHITELLLTRDKGKPKRLGDIMREAKSGARLTNASKLRFLLLGDPALRLAFPDDTYKAEVTEINGLDASSGSINIRALDNTVVTGHIVDESGEIVSDYNGTLEAVIFDSEQMLKTRGNVVGSDRGKDYKAYPNTLYAGRVEIKNGEFSIEFTVPKDILYLNNKGKMNFYAYDENGTREAQGSFLNYTVGGTNPGVPEEENPPVIERLVLNNTEVDLDDNKAIYVNPSPRFYAEISDDTGINLSSAIGHNIALIITNGVTTEEYNLTRDFVNEDGSTKRGSVTFVIPELSPGNYTIEFKVWDVFNNSASEYVDIIVSNDIGASDYNFEIWGNPANSITKFVFKTEGAVSGNVNLKMAVYSLSGKLVWIREERGAVSTLNGYEYDWNLMGNSGRVIPGIYICTGQAVIDGKAYPVQAVKLIVTN